jgi:hypothetical protein
MKPTRRAFTTVSKAGGGGLRPISTCQKDPLQSGVCGVLQPWRLSSPQWRPDKLNGYLMITHRNAVHIHFSGRTVVGHWSIDDDSRTVRRNIGRAQVCTLGRYATAIAREILLRELAAEGLEGLTAL